MREGEVRSGSAITVGRDELACSRAVTELPLRLAMTDWMESWIWATVEMHQDQLQLAEAGSEKRTHLEQPRRREGGFREEE